jgi:hypothetical protein
MNMSRAKIVVWARDLAGVAAVASIAYGAGLVYVPAGFVVGGALVLAGVVFAARGGI